MQVSRRGFLGGIIASATMAEADAFAELLQWLNRKPVSIAPPVGGWVPPVGGWELLLTNQEISFKNLMVLENSISFTKKVVRRYDDKFGRAGAEIGYILNIRKGTCPFNSLDPNLGFGADNGARSVSTIAPTLAHARPSSFK